MSARYAPIPSRRSSNGPEAERELDDAFESDNEDDNQLESTPLTHLYGNRSEDTPHNSSSNAASGVYDFERDYDYDRPPPGSPPRISSVAMPNDIGNSNGQLPTSPLGTTIPRPSFFRRAVGAILPTHYVRVPTSESSHVGARGGGIENDGVFANVMAKPTRPVQIRTEDGDVYMVPEEAQSQAPPSYADAQADAVPSYWENTIHAPSGLDLDSDMMIEDLPSGSILIFAANLFTSFFFQFVGFLLTYLLHTSHAAKYGSRAGLGLTLIQYGFYSRVTADDGMIPGDGVSGDEPLAWPTNNIDSSNNPLLSTSPTPTAPRPPDVGLNGEFNSTTHIWLSFLLMTLGWFLLLSSLIGYWRVKRWESSIRASSAQAAVVTSEDIQIDLTSRRNIERVFGMYHEEDSPEQRELGTPLAPPPHRNASSVIPDRQTLEQARLLQDLRAAGLL